MKKWLIGVVTGVSMSALFVITGSSVSAHSYYYWLRPHWVTVTKRVKIVKIKNTIPRVNSYAVKHTWVKRGHHLKVHHGASYLWVVESGKFNTNGYYTYVVAANKGWFKAGIH
ncbi:hypothetical protein [Lentilactobacillus sp. Marseille-Q4993]|uniref:hypothetical protein n=1 Tax=Lentilactobacillus sp. Marseille-Q4993 TaxID=3039492 RepID=UPI0024BC72E8|nr:hypothetical protein [Lentilactobacillus sp. Marseille-Q4993]